VTVVHTSLTPYVKILHEVVISHFINVTNLNHAAGLHCMNSSSLAGKNKTEDQNTRTRRHKLLHAIRGRIIKCTNSPPCACRSSTGQKP